MISDLEGVTALRTTQWQVDWVEDMPDEMERGKLYISVKHRLTEHLCACGCGAEVSLPLGNSEWWIVYDGDTVSFWPSVGNWRLPCKSHYLIRESKTQWCGPWSEKRILAGRKLDRKQLLRDIERKYAKQRRLRRFLNLIRFKN